MATDHDTSYKRLFAHAELLRELLAGFLPFAWAKRLRIHHCTRHNASYASDTGQQRHDDMVWRVRTGAPADDVYVLLEFQSQPDRWMALRMQVYAGLLQQELLKDGTLASTSDLPAVLPLVVYSGAFPGRPDVERDPDVATAGLHLRLAGTAQQSSHDGDG